MGRYLLLYGHNKTKGGGIMENEWLSICCTAEPMYELNDMNEEWDIIGICSQCREHTKFEIEEE